MSLLWGVRSPADRSCSDCICWRREIALTWNRLPANLNVRNSPNWPWALKQIFVNGNFTEIARYTHWALAVILTGTIPTQLKVVLHAPICKNVLDQVVRLVEEKNACILRDESHHG